MFMPSCSSLQIPCKYYVFAWPDGATNSLIQSGCNSDSILDLGAVFARNNVNP
jgi:hypothetical protein